MTTSSITILRRNDQEIAVLFCNRDGDPDPHGAALQSIVAMARPSSAEMAACVTRGLVYAELHPAGTRPDADIIYTLTAQGVLHGELSFHLKGEHENSGYVFFDGGLWNFSACSADRHLDNAIVESDWTQW